MTPTAHAMDGATSGSSSSLLATNIGNIGWIICESSEVMLLSEPLTECVVNCCHTATIDGKLQVAHFLPSLFVTVPS